MRRRNQAAVSAVTVVAVALLAACTHASPSTKGTAIGFGTLPAQQGSPRPGGTVRLALQPGATPNWIFPIEPAAESSLYNAFQFEYLSWRPLYWSPNGSAPEVSYPLSLAREPTFAADGRTITIAMNPGYTWSDGSPVTATDCVFFIDLLKAAVSESPANFGNYTPGQFPDNLVSATATDPNTLRLVFDKQYNPQRLFLSEIGLIVPLPSRVWAIDATGGPPLDFSQPANGRRIYDYLSQQSRDRPTYATNPLWQVVDGPFVIRSYDVSTGANSFVANPRYTGPNKPNIARLDQVPYPTTTAEFADLSSGKLDIGFVDFTDIARVPSLRSRGYNVYGLPSFGFYYIAYNFKDTTGHFDKIIKELYVRQALAHLQDQESIISGPLKGAGAPAYGPVPAIPASPFAPVNAKTNPYPFDIGAAGKLLTDHGWQVVPNGQTTCRNAGSGPGQCGAGIPAGTPLSFNIFYANSPVLIGQEVSAWSAAARKVGITISGQSKTFDVIVANYGNPQAPGNANQWAAVYFGGFTQGLYPTSNNLFNSGGSYNQGSYSDPQLDRLIQDSLYGSDPQAVQKEAAYITQNLPGLFQPNTDRIYAWKTSISGPPEAFANLTQGAITPELWYYKR